MEQVATSASGQEPGRPVCDGAGATGADGARSPWRRLGERPGAYWVVAAVLAVVLLAAAALKGEQIATGAVGQEGVLNGRWEWMRIPLVEAEAALAVWLLSGVWPRLARRVAMALFAAFALVSLYEAVSGQTSCGCFGKVGVHPWWMVLVDGLAVAALAVCHPPTPAGRLRPGGPGRLRLGVAVMAWVAVGVLGTWKMGLGGAAGPDVAEELIPPGTSPVVLHPQRWVGKRLELLSHIDVGQKLARGRWVLVLYHSDCETCREAVPRYVEVAEQWARRAPGPQVAFVEMPPYAGSAQAGEAQTVRLRAGPSRVLGRLSDERQWFAQTPVAIWIEEGRVRAVAQGTAASSPASGPNW